MKKIAIFGSTGSVGNTTLDVIRNNPEKFIVTILVAGENIKKLIEQIKEFKPKYVYIQSKKNALNIEREFDVKVFYGEKGLNSISSLKDYDIGVSALSGILGLIPTYNMIKNGKIVALANKEVLVVGGQIIIDAVKKYNAKLITVDSEHSAIMQCLNGEDKKTIYKVLLTASGGPFLHKEINNDIKKEEALCHPTWHMGQKISIDSATMMNKGFELIEAKWLFNLTSSQIEIVINSQSFVHSMVEFNDGTIIANIGPKSMEIPISYALNLKGRINNNIEKLDLFKIKELTFERPDYERFKSLKLALKAMDSPQCYSVILNALDEIFVNAFLQNKIGFKDIVDNIDSIINNEKHYEIKSIEDIIALDRLIKEKYNIY